MTETLPIPGRPDVLQLEHRGGLIHWCVGDCRGSEATRAAALAVAERYLGVRVVHEVRSMLRASHRSWSPSSRRPGSGQQTGVVYVSTQLPRDYVPLEMCRHGLEVGRCDACGAEFCRHSGARAHTCFPEAGE